MKRIPHIPDGAKILAQWETTGHDYLILYRGQLDNGKPYYAYIGNGQGGGFDVGSIESDEQAIERMSSPWGPNVGPVTVLKADRPSLKRTL